MGKKCSDWSVTHREIADNPDIKKLNNYLRNLLLDRWEKKFPYGVMEHASTIIHYLLNYYEPLKRLPPQSRQIKKKIKP